MTSKKLSSSRPVSSLIAHILKTVGIVITLAALLDMFLLPIPYQLAEQQWQINFVTAFVDRGIVPLVGLVLFLTGFAVDGSSVERKAAWQDPRFWAFILASVLGVAYVLMFPFHLNNVRLANQSAIETVNQQATQAETELNERLQSEIEARRQQISQLLTASDDQIAQLVQGGQLTQEQAEVVKRFKAEPQSVEPFLKQQGEELQTQLQTEIGLRKKQAQEARRTEDLKSGLRIGIGSLLLAIGFSIVGWTGLRNLRQM
ncbi:MAG: hypothetical protein HC827_00135 [Cyanobacteria bacterium RM1_2_2]|nr:hypothetical protein [Cyanobacteria bacterium RM1_2_2]